MVVPIRPSRVESGTGVSTQNTRSCKGSKQQEVLPQPISYHRQEPKSSQNAEFYSQHTRSFPLYLIYILQRSSKNQASKQASIINKKHPPIHSSGIIHIASPAKQNKISKQASRISYPNAANVCMLQRAKAESPQLSRQPYETHYQKQKHSRNAFHPFRSNPSHSQYIRNDET